MTLIDRLEASERDVLIEALREIEAITARKKLPITAQINQIAIDALAAALKVSSHE